MQMHDSYDHVYMYSLFLKLIVFDLVFKCLSFKGPMLNTSRSSGLLQAHIIHYIYDVARDYICTILQDIFE